jgi:hypothetical protein
MRIEGKLEWELEWESGEWGSERVGEWESGGVGEWEFELEAWH